ncbi:DUF4265 domain-containing protein [Streptomyces sp. NPDC057746]|uniref:DUF4265 domain-containing protein n=1 Tax=Streptomyces sp. NPDC057746 TaxID=3346237 RepID=UPI003691DEC2
MSQASERPVSAGGAKLFKVAFDLDVDASGWPPVSVERLWGEKTDVRSEIRVVNTPFFVSGIAYGDLVQVRPDHERRELVYDHFTEESGHSTVRVVFMRDEARGAVEQRLTESGCDWETPRQFENLMAVDVPPDVDYATLRRWLLERVDGGGIEIQESALSQVHRTQIRPPGAAG